MCHRCTTAARITRRTFLTFAGGAAVGLALPTSGFAQKAPPKPQNIVSADEALKLLMDGNRRYARAAQGGTISSTNVKH